MFTSNIGNNKGVVHCGITISDNDHNTNNKQSVLANRIQLVCNTPELMNNAVMTGCNKFKHALPSEAHIGIQLYQTGPDSPLIVKEFLQNTLSNNRYESLEHLQTRAENYLRYRSAEGNILRATTEGLEKPESAVFKQTSWMGHLERGLWHAEERWGGNDREQLEPIPKGFYSIQ